MQVAISMFIFLALMTWATAPRTTFDLLVSPQTTWANPVKKMWGGRVEFFYRAFQTCLLINFSSDIDCDAEVFTPNPESESWILKTGVTLLQNLYCVMQVAISMFIFWVLPVQPITISCRTSRGKLWLTPPARTLPYYFFCLFPRRSRVTLPKGGPPPRCPPITKTKRKKKKIICFIYLYIYINV